MMMLYDTTVSCRKGRFIRRVCMPLCVYYLCSEAPHPSHQSSQGHHHTICPYGYTHLGPSTPVHWQDTGSFCCVSLENKQNKIKETKNATDFLWEHKQLHIWCIFKETVHLKLSNLIWLLHLAVGLLTYTVDIIIFRKIRSKEGYILNSTVVKNVGYLQFSLFSPANLLINITMTFTRSGSIRGRHRTEIRHTKYSQSHAQTALGISYTSPTQPVWLYLCPQCCVNFNLWWVDR